MNGNKKNFQVDWYVHDNPVTYSHWVSMLVTAENRAQAISVAIDRIKTEFDYDFKYCEIADIQEL